MNVFIPFPIHADALAWLRANSRVRTITGDEPDAADWEKKADAVILRSTKISGDEIRRAARLKVIGRHGVGIDVVDLDAAREKGIKVLNAPFENTQSVAELAVGFMLALARRIPQAINHVRSGLWAEGRKADGCTELFENTVGFVGFGRIARKTATILKNGFSMKILAYAPRITDAAWNDLRDFVTPCKTLPELFASSSYVSIHVPKTKETINLIDANILAAAKKGMLLVNTSRGGIVDEQALYSALVNGTIRAAASDVFAKEPLDVDSPLLTLPNFIATPHYAGTTEDCLRRVSAAIARQTVAALFDEEDPAYRRL